ncbi:MAG: helix-turn-helix domain-containing protein [Clostridia bacterium]|nr:helix-turn-helix domain-containing protein [Clostridia bacterium]
MTDIGTKIATLRADRNISQQALADRLYVSRFLVSRWESGERRPDYNMIRSIAEVLGVRPEEIADINSMAVAELMECIGGSCGLTEDELALAIGAFLRKNNALESKIFIQRYYHLKSTSETAILFGIGENHVRSLLSRTRRKLKKFLAGYSAS